MSRKGSYEDNFYDPIDTLISNIRQNITLGRLSNSSDEERCFDALDHTITETEKNSLEIGTSTTIVCYNKIDAKLIISIQ